MAKYDIYTISQPEPGHYRILSPAAVYMELFVGTERALLLDTGFGFGDLRGAVRSITDLPLVIVCTHGHSDHTFGNGLFTEPVYLDKRDMDLCRRQNNRAHREKNIRIARHWGAGYGGAEEEGGPEVKYEDILSDSFDEETYLTLGCGDLRPLDPEQCIDLGGLHLMPVHVPGHTAGSIGLLWQEKNIFFSGDAMNPDVWLFFPESLPLSVYRETLYKAKALHFDGMYCSHHHEFMAPSVLDDYLELAIDPDFEHGYAFVSEMAEGVEARLCIRKGYRPEDTHVPGFAGMVIDRAHL